MMGQVGSALAVGSTDVLHFADTSHPKRVYLLLYVVAHFMFNNIIIQ